LVHDSGSDPKYSAVSEKKLFREIKKWATDWNKLLEELRESSSLYNKILEGNDTDFQDLKNGQKIYRSIFSIRLMDVSQCYVLFLSILRNYKKLGTDPTKIFQLIEDFTFKYSVISNLPGNKVEKIYSKYAINIEKVLSKENSKKAGIQIQKLFAELRKELNAEKPSFELFTERFADVSYKNSEQGRKLTKYILGKINDYYAKTQEQKIDFYNVNIEHILPQKPHKDWKLTKKAIKPYVNKLGNLTLVGKRINSKVQNKIIKEKIQELRRSQLPITKELVKSLESLNLTWGEAEIIARQEELADLAYNKVWT
jgi:hypothetical protein